MKGRMNQMEEVGEGGFTLLPAATYDFEVVEKADGTSKNGDPMINVKLEVRNGPKKGSFVFDRIILSTNPNSPGWNIRWRAKTFLKAIGEPHHGDVFDWDSDRWMYKKLTAEVRHEVQKEGKYAGKPKAVIAAYITEPAGSKEDPEIPF